MNAPTSICSLIRVKRITLKLYKATNDFNSTTAKVTGIAIDEITIKGDMPIPNHNSAAK
jgi:hypothetical protein